MKECSNNIEWTVKTWTWINMIMMIIWQTLEARTELTWLLATAAESLINMRDIVTCVLKPSELLSQYMPSSLLLAFSNHYVLILWFVLIQFFHLSISLEELDDFSDSGSDFEATMKAIKRPKPALPGPPVSYLFSFKTSLVYILYLDNSQESTSGLSPCLSLVFFILFSHGCIIVSNLCSTQKIRKV